MGDLNNRLPNIIDYEKNSIQMGFIFLEEGLERITNSDI